MQKMGKSMAAYMAAALPLLSSVPQLCQPLGRLAATPDRGPEFIPLAPLVGRHRIGPGRKTLDTHHKKIGRSRYMPHQGSQEKLRRWKRMELTRGDA